MDENEIAVGTALLPLETLQGHLQTVRLARSMMKGWLAFTADSRESHEKALLQRQIANMGEVIEFFECVIRQHEEWTRELVGERR
jgi:hypothetical protein